MDIFSSCFDEVNTYVTYAEQNGQSAEGAKTLSLKMNDYIKANELRRFALGLSFLVWPFNNTDASPTACFFAISAAKRLIKTVTDSVIQRVTYAPKSKKQQSKAMKAASKHTKKNNSNTSNNNDHLTLELFQQAITKCNAIFLQAFFKDGIAANARRLINNCIGSFVTLSCALGNREVFNPQSIPWPDFHENYLRLLDQNPEIAWGFIHEFVIVFHEDGSAFPNLTGYAAELIVFGIQKQMNPILAACSDFARSLDAPSTILGNLFRSVATFLTISASDSVLAFHDRGGKNRREAQQALETFRNACHRVIDTATQPLLNFFQVLPESLYNFDTTKNDLPTETFETILQALECARGALNRLGLNSDDGENSQQMMDTNISFTRSVIMIIGALSPHAAAVADSQNVVQCACTAITTLTEVLDNVDEQAIKQVLASPLQPAKAFTSEENAAIGPWFIRCLLNEWLVLRQNDDGYNTILQSSNGGDWNQPDREQDVPFRIGSQTVKRSNLMGDDDEDDDIDDDDNDQNENGDIADDDDNEVGGAMLEDGITRTPVRTCVLELLGALATILPDQTAQTVFGICTGTLNDAAEQLASSNNSNNNNNNKQRDILAGRAEAAFVAMSEIVEETFFILRSNGEVMGTLINAVFNTSSFTAFSERPAVLASSIRCAGMIAVACASAATNKPDDDEIDDDRRKYMTRQDVDVCTQGALQMLRHLLCQGLNSRFKRCQWTAIHNLVMYVKTIAMAVGHLDGEDDDDDDEEDEDMKRLAAAKNARRGNAARNNQEPSCVIPADERRRVLFPPQYEEALAQIVFAPDGSNWVENSSSSAPTRRIALIEADAVPKIQLMSRALLASLVRALIHLDEYTAPRLNQQQQVLERSSYLFTHRFIDPMMECIRVAWTGCPETNLLELSMYAHLLQSIRTVLAIPSFDKNTDSFFIFLERYAPGMRDLCINALRYLEAGSTYSQSKGSLFRGIPIDGIIAVLIDLISELCDGLALGSARLINLNAITGKNIQSCAETVNGVHLVNAVSSKLVLTGDLMDLARSFATSRRGEKRRAAFAVLSDYAASCFWWRSMISSESSELVLLPIDDSNQTNAFNLPPPFLNELNPALPTLRPYFKDVLDLCCKELYNYANLDDDDVTEENSAAAGNACWCLCQWLGAAVGPAQQSAEVIKHAVSDHENYHKNPNTQFVLDSLPFPHANLMRLLALLLCASSQSMFRASLRDNCLMCILRTATMIPQLMGPVSSAHPVVNVKNSQLEEIISNGFIASAVIPLASLIVPRLTNPSERCETLMRIAALGSTGFGPNNSEFTAVQAALQQQPVALFTLISSVEKGDDPKVVELWQPIVQFVASAGQTPPDMSQAKKAKFLKIFGVRF